MDADALLAAQLQAEDLEMDVDALKEEDDDLELARALEELGRESSRQGRSQSAVQVDQDGWEQPPEFDSDGDEMEEVELDGDAADAVGPIAVYEDSSEVEDRSFEEDVRQASLLSRMSTAVRRSVSGSAVPFEIVADDEAPVAGPGPRTLAHRTGQNIEEDAPITDSSSPAPPSPQSAALLVPAQPPPPPPTAAAPQPPTTPRPRPFFNSATARPAVSSKDIPPPLSQRHPPTAVPLPQPPRARPPPVQPKKDVITLSDTDSDDDMEPVDRKSVV